MMNSYVMWILSQLKFKGGNSLGIQWLRLCALTAVGSGSIPGGGNNLAIHAAQPKKKKEDAEETFKMFVQMVGPRRLH